MTSQINKDNLKTLYLWDANYYTTFTKKFENRKKYEPVNEKHVFSFIPGIVQKIMVKPQQEVKRGETLLIFESMKMMNKVRAHIDGKIKSINVTEGENVPKGHLMIEFE